MRLMQVNGRDPAAVSLEADGPAATGPRSRRAASIRARPDENPFRPVCCAASHALVPRRAAAALDPQAISGRALDSARHAGQHAPTEPPIMADLKTLAVLTGGGDAPS